MANIQRLRSLLREVRLFAEHNGTTLHRLAGGTLNEDVAETWECETSLREAIADLETLSSAAGNLRIRIWEVLGAEGLDK